MTATPCHLDGKGLGDFFDTFVGVPSVQYLIKHGFNAPWRLFAPHNPDVSGIKFQAGDYVIESLEDLMNDPILIGNVIEHFKEKAGGKALVFCVSNIQRKSSSVSSSPDIKLRMSIGKPPRMSARAASLTLKPAVSISSRP